MNQSEVLKAVEKLDGIKAEIIGKWVWASGATYANREALKAAGMVYSPNRRAWYWRPVKGLEDLRTANPATVEKPVAAPVEKPVAKSPAKKSRAASGEWTAAQKKVVERICKRSSGNYNHPCTDGERVYYTDGYTMIVTPENVLEADAERRDMSGFARILNGAKEKAGEVVQLPDADTIKVAAANRKNPDCLEVSPGWWCNSYYLKELLAALPGAVARIPEKWNAPMFFTSPRGDAILMPVRHPKAETKAA